MSPTFIRPFETESMPKEPDPKEVEKAEKEYQKGVQADKEKQLRERGK